MTQYKRCDVIYLQAQAFHNIHSQMLQNHALKCSRSPSAARRPTRRAVPSPTTRVHSVRHRAAPATRHRLRAQLWSNQHHHPTPHHSRRRLPGLSRRHSRRRLHLPRYSLRHTLLPTRNTLLSRPQK